MNVVEAKAEIFWTAFNSLSKKEKEAVIKKILGDKNLLEDLIDILIIEKRKKEPSRTLEEYLTDKGKKN